MKPHASIDKAINGYTVSLRSHTREKDEWYDADEYVYLTLEEALAAVTEYFKLPDGGR